MFALTRRRDGKRPGDESLDHLTCWKELAASGAAGAGKCNAIVAGIQSAREEFCSAYHKLYHELYICNKQVLDQLPNRCENLPHEVHTKQKECGSRCDPPAAMFQLQNLIDKNGELVPPKEIL